MNVLKNKIMSSVHKLKKINSVLFLVAILALLPYGLQAQRMGHSASRGGGRSMSRPAPSRSHSNAGSRQTQSRQTQSRQSSNRKSTTTRPSTTNKSINGGHKKTTTRPSTTNKKTTRPSTGNKTTNRSADRSKKNNIKNSGNKNINIDNSKNINVSRNNHVNRSSRSYHRPPYRYGGHRYYCHRPYFYHPYRPFYWGPAWHPWGFVVRTITATAIIISINNQAYHYDSGVYYVESNGAYTVVQAPVGATVKEIPKEAEKVAVTETTNNYYYGGDFYEKNSEGYKVVPATAGTIVPSLPEGGEEVKVGENTYVQFGEVYYQPIQVDGKDMYEIVEVREDE